MPSVLFVCTANICRSPVAEALFADWLRRSRTPGEWRVSSAGTWAQPGLRASTFSIEVARDRGLDLRAHRSRAVDAAMMRAADVVVCMTRAQREALQAAFPEHAGRVHLLAAMVGTAYDVADPYGSEREAYAVMLAELRELIEAGGPRIVALATAKDEA